MIISVFSDELALDIYEAVPVLKQWGIDTVDLRGRINGKAIERQTDEELRELKAFLDAEGMRVGAIQSSLCKVHLPDKQRQQEELEKLEGIIRAANILDCRLVRSFNYWQYDENDPRVGELAVRPDMLSLVLEMFEPVAKRAKEAGLILSFENCGQSPAEVVAVLDALNVPEWGMAFDLANMFDILPEAKGDATEYLAKYIPRANMLHVKARATLSVFDKFRNVPWRRVLAAVSALGMDIPVSIETHNPAGSPYTPQEATKLCVDEIRRCMPSAAPGSLNEALAVMPEFVRPYADNPVTFVVVGLGMGKNRVAQITQTSGTKLVGVCDINLAKAKEVGEAFNVPYSDDIEVFLKDPAVEVMYVVTPTGEHCSVAKQCLAAGKHVLTTKPMDVNTKNCDEAIALAKEKGLLLGVDFDVRHRQEYAYQRAAVDNGFFGEILWADIRLLIKRTQDYYNENGGWRGTWAMDGGGALCNQGVHEVDRMMLLLGIPQSVRGTISTQAHDIETEDAGVTEWRYANGCIARFSSTTNYPIATWNTRIEIHGTKGAYIHTAGGPEGDHSWWGTAQGGWSEEPPYPVERKWRQGSDNFANSVRTGEPLDIDGDQGRISRLILDAVYKSARENGAWVDIPTDGGLIE